MSKTDGVSPHNTVSKIAEIKERNKKACLAKIAKIICPVCGYYCLGNGGFGCIDKKGLYEIGGKKVKP